MRSFRVWLGALLLVLGVLWLLDVAGVVDAGDLIARWWPLAVIALGVFALVSERRLAPGPVIVLLFGVALLIGEFSVGDAGQVLWPVLFVAVGGWLLLNRAFRRGPLPSSQSRDAFADRQDVFALLGGSHAVNRSPSFRHADVTAVFGGATLDLREAVPAPDARVDALALFGGVEVIVPSGWRVELSGLPIFGGYQDKTAGHRTPVADGPVLKVVATAVFGGVEIKNATGQLPSVPSLSAGPPTVGPDLR
ncbi:MAG TPA: LiaF domain-containing protein [Microlunatus sp.]|nr:LiaF domain-containing protein [Microlunatus sp.]